MRLKPSRFRRNFNKDLPIEFTEQNLSSFGGLGTVFTIFAPR